MRLTVSDNATPQATVAVRHAASQELAAIFHWEKKMTGMTCIPLSALELSAAMRAALPYDEARLNRILRVDERHGLLEVQSGTPWKTIAAALRPGDARAAGVATLLPTVGASLAHNGAGPDGRPAVMHVESLAVVTPTGELRRADRAGNRELFSLVAGGRGLFGAVYSVTLSIGSLARTLNEAADADVVEPRKPHARSRALRLLLPHDKVDGFLADARRRCTEWRLPLAGAKLRRTVREQDTFLCWAGRDYTALTLYLAEPDALGMAVRATQLRRELIDAVIAHGGSFSLSCTPEATRSQALACYPKLPAFLAEKRRVDPTERLTNAWYAHYRNLFGRPDCAVRWTH